LQCRRRSTLPIVRFFSRCCRRHILKPDADQAGALEIGSHAVIHLDRMTLAGIDRPVYEVVTRIRDCSNEKGPPERA
jgi:hypothetical protein